MPPTFSPQRPDVLVQYAVSHRLSANPPETNGIANTHFSFGTPAEPTARREAKPKYGHELASYPPFFGKSVDGKTFVRILID